MCREAKALSGRAVSILPLHQGQMSNDIKTGSEQVFKANGLERFLVSNFSEILTEYP